MDRKEFLKVVCGIGACGCVAHVLGAGEASAAQSDAADQRLAFVRRRMSKMVGFMAGGSAAPACVEVLEKTGRECATLTGLAARFKGNPEGYFAASRKAWGTEFEWNREKTVVTVTSPDVECGCPMVDPASTPAFWCNCAVGYQKEAFGAVFGRPVQVKLAASRLAGDKRCIFEVRLGA
jgi:hypothetical protein